MNTGHFIWSRHHRLLYGFADSPALCTSLLDSGVRIIQLRAKSISDQEFRSLAKEMQQMVRAHPVPAVFIVNDRADIALDIESDGLHLGQGDSDYRQVIKSAPTHMSIGVSVHTVDQALVAQAAGAAYVGAGAIFPTVTKSDARVIGLGELEKIVAATTIPVAAIGGIGLENIDQVVRAGAHYFAIISDINEAPSISGRVRELNQRIKEHSGR